MPASLESFFGAVNLADWSNDQEVPIWSAKVISPAIRQALATRR
jgi:hypothetical protein